MITKKLFVFADGGARGNPGPAAIGFIIKNSTGKTLVKKGKFVGKATNNVAEYQAVIEALKWLSKRKAEKGWGWVMGYESGCEDEGEEKKKKPTPTTHPRPTTHISTPPSIQFFLDSKLIVNQLNGLFKIKNSYLRGLIIKVRQLEQEVGGNVSYHFIPREKNKEADALVNQSLEQKSL